MYNIIFTLQIRVSLDMDIYKNALYMKAVCCRNKLVSFNKGVKCN